ncbi:MAG TPA: pyroglutamyl-peptidase I [Hyphomicrobiaceae bacterium]|nr:pyroglutamyl-peptidase I [Hyphomicrobiaceae bacterium]
MRYPTLMSGSRPVILLTGFGPFPRVPVNATSILVPRIAEAARASFPGICAVAEILPTEWVAGLARLEQLYAQHRPHLALHFGVSHRATGFAVEARGRNRCAPSPDGAGALPASACISADAPEFLPANLPAALIVERLRRRGLPAQLSRDAGSYLCNALLYRAVELSRRGVSPVRNGFIHLPETLVDPRRPDRQPTFACPLSWQQVIDGSLDIIATCLGRWPATSRRSARGLSPSPSASAGA